MDLSGFRIGNCVNVCDNDEILTGVNKVGVDFGRHGYCANIADFIKPIPLTEEWLLKLGFEYDNESKTYSILTALELFDYLFEIKQYNGYFEPDFLRIQIEYVHQLQNLYFALTGQELEITKA